MDFNEFLIPYFSFQDLSSTKILMRIYIEKAKFPKISFKLEEFYVTVSSEKYKSRQYHARIHLPCRILKPTEKLDYHRMYNNAKHYYELILEKYRESDADAPERVLQLKDLDVVSKYLSWSKNCLEDGSDLKIVQTTNDDDTPENVTILVEQMSLGNFNESNNKIYEESRSHQISDKSREFEFDGLYGFAGRYRQKLSSFKGNWQTAIELPNPESKDFSNRNELRWEEERQAFDVDYYLADYFLESVDESNDTLSLLYTCIHYEPYWYIINHADEKELTPQQMKILANLPYKSFQLTSFQRMSVLHSLFDLILAYAYDHRVNEGLHSSESAWNINKLSPTLSWFQIHRNIGEVVVSFMRRSLSYPLLRHWILNLKVLEDALKIFRLGRRQLLNCLVSIYELFEADDVRKLLNELYIEDYLIWIQQVDPVTIENYAELIASCKQVEKEDAFSMLPDIEQEAIQILEMESKDEYNTWRNHLNDLISFTNGNSSKKS